MKFKLLLLAVLTASSTAFADDRQVVECLDLAKAKKFSIVRTLDAGVQTSLTLTTYQIVQAAPYYIKSGEIKNAHIEKMEMSKMFTKFIQNIILDLGRSGKLQVNFGSTGIQSSKAIVKSNALQFPYPNPTSLYCLSGFNPKPALSGGN